MQKNLLNIQELAMTDDFLDPPEHVLAGRAQFEPWSRFAAWQLWMCYIWPVDVHKRELQMPRSWTESGPTGAGTIGILLHV